MTASNATVVRAPTRAAIRKRLVEWYGKARRDLPWRRSSDPYAIWVSEVMLQQTRVEAVIGFYERWMRRFPTLGHLAEAPESEVLRAWEGLGYYSRARRLREGAIFVRERFQGRVPASVSELREIPGIGPYTAGAIASIAHGQRAPVVDGNVVRVLSRLFALRGDPTKTKAQRRLWELAAELVPASHPSDFNQALMELGATVCTPRNASCHTCPLASSCLARREQLVEQLPELPKRPAPTEVTMVAALLHRRGKWLLVQLPTDAPRWAGMWSFPTAEVETPETPEAAAARAAQELTGLRVEAGARLDPVRHQVTRFKITLHPIECELGPGRLRPPQGTVTRFCDTDDMHGLALPIAQRRIAKRLG